MIFSFSNTKSGELCARPLTQATGAQCESQYIIPLRNNLSTRGYMYKRNGEHTSFVKTGKYDNMYFQSYGGGFFATIYSKWCDEINGTDSCYEQTFYSLIGTWDDEENIIRGIFWQRFQDWPFKNNKRNIGINENDIGIFISKQFRKPNELNAALFRLRYHQWNFGTQAERVIMFYDEHYMLFDSTFTNKELNDYYFSKESIKGVMVKNTARMEIPMWEADTTNNITYTPKGALGIQWLITGPLLLKNNETLRKQWIENTFQENNENVWKKGKTVVFGATDNYRTNPNNSNYIYTIYPTRSVNESFLGSNSKEESVFFEEGVNFAGVYLHIRSESGDTNHKPNTLYSYVFHTTPYFSIEANYSYHIDFHPPTLHLYRNDRIVVAAITKKDDSTWNNRILFGVVDHTKGRIYGTGFVTFIDKYYSITELNTMFGGPNKWKELEKFQLIFIARLNPNYKGSENVICFRLMLIDGRKQYESHCFDDPELVIFGKNQKITKADWKDARGNQVSQNTDSEFVKANHKTKKFTFFSQMNNLVKLDSYDNKELEYNMYKWKTLHIETANLKVKFGGEFSDRFKMTSKNASK